MPTQVQAAVAREKGQPWSVEDLELDDPQRDEVLVRIHGTGVCHTDLIARDQHYPIPHPIVGGHEGAGVVERVGNQVREVSVGDHVVLCNLSCGSCRLCLTGNPSYCLRFAELNFSGTRPDGTRTLRREDGPVHGSLFGQSSFATHALAKERGVVVVDRELPLDMLGPLGCGIQTGAGAVLNSLQPHAGSRLVVYGAGSVGLSAVMGAKIVGCHPIIAVEPQRNRRDLAEELGATHTIDPNETNPIEAVKNLTGGEGADYSLECIGSADTFRQAVDSITQCGEAAMVGAAPMGTEAAIDISSLLFGRRIRGVVEGSSMPQVFIPQLIDLWQAGLLPFDRLVEHHNLDQVNDVFHNAFEEGTQIKPVLCM